MMSDEHLYRELQEQEREDDVRFRQNRSMDALRGFQPKPVDMSAAMQRYAKEFAPVFERRRRAMTSKAYRIWLKATGQWKGMEVGDVEVVDPSKGLKLVGPTIEDVQREIAANPAKFKHLIRNAPKVSPVAAAHRKLEPKLSDEPRDDS